MGLVCQSDAIPNAGSRFDRFDFDDDDDVLLPLCDCNFGHGLNDEIRLLGTESRKQLRVECRKVVITMVKYLISHLPLKNSFLKDLSYFNPNLRQEASFIPSLMRAAKEVGRFTDQEMTDISSQLNMVKTLQGIPEFSDETHSMDHFIIGVVVKMVKEHLSIEALALRKMIIIFCTIPHSNAFLERGFSDTKRIVEGRETLSEDSLASQKTCLDVIRNSGGVVKIIIESGLIVAVQGAHQNKNLEIIRKNRAHEAAKAKEKREEVARVEKRKFEEENSSWEELKKVKKTKINKLKLTLEGQNAALEKALDDIEKVKNNVKRIAALNTARLA